MSALESLHFLAERRHPTVIEILLLLRKLERKGFDIIFPGYLDTWVYLNYIHRVWQETWNQQILNKLHNIHPSTSHWAALPVRRHDVRLTRLRIGHTRFTHRHLLLAENAPECPSCFSCCLQRLAQYKSWSQQLDNKLHSVKPVIGAWPVMPMRRTDVKLTRLRIGHSRFTHRHLLFGERAPECPSCHVSYTVHHILIDCPVFNNYRITFFNSSQLTLPDLVGEIPHQNLFAFIRRIGFLYLL
ncbi:putative RNA-directed DNA polymerase from transposon X-element [Trichonephila clavipes]|uniref:Putative RNA-directed DNA polymerase from transposon X-element n=1 Tax=Trichonephila clavipes TaxID=2585209 RepID=A0A8X6WDG1_TRICX|nr:putative RNA-directed DNA polymerase from transposon X-element [Trichonephila clavipes]